MTENAGRAEQLKQSLEHRDAAAAIAGDSRFSDIFSREDSVLAGGRGCAGDANILSAAAKIAGLKRYVSTDKGPFQIVADYDGTVASFTGDPRNPAIDTGCRNAITELARSGIAEVTFISGRSCEDLLPRVSLAGQEATDARGPVPFHLIGSHGTEYLPAGKEMSEVRRAGIFPDFERCIQLWGEGLERLYGDMGLIIGYKYPGIDLNVAGLAPAMQGEIINTLERELRNLLYIYGQEAQEQFTIARESDHEICLRPSRFDKGYALTAWGHIKPDVPTIFLCDSLGPEGTDRHAAEIVNRDFTCGYVGAVLNGRNNEVIRDVRSDAAFKPHIVFASPHQLGAYLTYMVREIEPSTPHVPGRSREMQSPVSDGVRPGA